jgi:hypothetical protein
VDKIMREKNTSGHLLLEKADVVYSANGKELWRLPVTQIRVIGEYTTANGPYVDDYFLVFVVRQSTEWFEASYYAQRDDSFRKNLGNLLGGDEIRFGLNNSTDWKHRVLWPKNLEGSELFEITPEKESENWLQRIKQKIFTNKVIELSKPVRELCVR